MQQQIKELQDAIANLTKGLDQQDRHFSERLNTQRHALIGITDLYCTLNEAVSQLTQLMDVKHFEIDNLTKRINDLERKTKS